MTTKYKIEFGNGTVFEATCERDMYGYRYDFYHWGDEITKHKNILYEKTLKTIGAKVTPIYEPITITKEQFYKCVADELKKQFSASLRLTNTSEQEFYILSKICDGLWSRIEKVKDE